MSDIILEKAKAAVAAAMQTFREMGVKTNVAVAQAVNRDLLLQPK